MMCSFTVPVRSDFAPLLPHFAPEDDLLELCGSEFLGSEFFEFEDLSSSGYAAFLLFCLRLDVDFTKTLSKPPISLLLHPKKSNAYTEPNVKTYDILTKANKVRAIIVDIVAFLESIFLILEKWIYTC